MSQRFRTRVWESAPVDGTLLVLLLAIAEIASDGGVCSPSVAFLAERARITKRQTRRLLRTLEEMGLIAIARSTGRGNYSVIRLSATALSPKQPADFEHPKHDRSTGTRDIGNRASDGRAVAILFLGSVQDLR